MAHLAFDVVALNCRAGILPLALQFIVKIRVTPAIVPPEG